MQCSEVSIGFVEGGQDRKDMTRDVATLLNSLPTIQINSSEEEKLSIIGQICLLRILSFARRRTKESTAGKTREGCFEDHVT